MFVEFVEWYCIIVAYMKCIVKDFGVYFVHHDFSYMNNILNNCHKFLQCRNITISFCELIFCKYDQIEVFTDVMFCLVGIK